MPSIFSRSRTMSRSPSTVSSRSISTGTLKKRRLSLIVSAAAEKSQGAILIYAGLITPFSVYLLTTFFRTVPNELFESARMDGANDFTILLKIVLPLSAPALVTLLVVNSLYVWNDLLIAIIFLQDDAKRFAGNLDGRRPCHFTAPAIRPRMKYFWKVM